MGTIYNLSHKEFYKNIPFQLMFAPSDFVSNYRYLQATRNNEVRSEDPAEKESTYPFGGGLAVALWLLDAVLVRLVRLVVRRVVLRLSHPEPLLLLLSVT
jgi:hypothetical protein